MLLVLNVIYYGKIATHVAKDIHKSNGWSSQWLKRYREEGISGLKDRPKGKTSKDTKTDRIQNKGHFERK